MGGQSVAKGPGDMKVKQYVHMLNATLCATSRTICCILENYQEDDGVRVPSVLQPYMGGVDFLPFKRPPPDNKTKQKQAMAILSLLSSLFSLLSSLSLSLLSLSPLSL